MSDTDLDYLATMSAVTTAAQLLLAACPDNALEEALNTIIKAHTVMPIVDPTAYRDGVGNLRDQETIIRAAITFRNACLSLKPAEAP